MVVPGSSLTPPQEAHAKVASYPAAGQALWGRGSDFAAPPPESLGGYEANAKGAVPI